MMRIGVLILFLCVASFNMIGQHTITIKKGQTITGVFKYQHEDGKEKDYLIFDETGVVTMFFGTKMKEKKAVPYMLACNESETSCTDIAQKDYVFEKNHVTFSFGGSNYLKSYEGMFQENGTQLVFKVSETDKILKVRVFERVE